jgi:membrane protease YdiL (CAAX protease family)
MWWLSKSRGTGSLAADFGLAVRLSDWWALLAGMGLQVAVALLMAPLIQVLFPEGPPQQEVAALTASSSGRVAGLLVIAMVGLLAPLVEEMMFRGMLLSRTVRSMSSAWAVIATAGVFAGVHLLDPNAIAVLPGLFLIGVVLAIASLRRGDLSLAIPLHAGVNLTAAVLLVFGDQLSAWLEDAQQNLDQIEGLVRFWL